MLVPRIFKAILNLPPKMMKYYKSRRETLIVMPEKLTQSVETPVFIASTLEELTYSSSRVAKWLSCHYCSSEEISRASEALSTFLQFIYRNPSIDAIAFFDRKEQYLRPILDVFILWTTPVDLRTSGQEMRAVGDEHSDFVASLEPTVDSLLSIVDPITYPSPEFLQSVVSDTDETFSSPELIACIKLQKQQTRYSPNNGLR